MSAEAISFVVPIVFKSLINRVISKKSWNDCAFKAAAQVVIYRINDIALSTISVLVSLGFFIWKSHEWAKEALTYSLNNLLIRIFLKIFPNDEPIAPTPSLKDDFSLQSIIKMLTCKVFGEDNFKEALKTTIIWTLSFVLTQLILFGFGVTSIFLILQDLIPYFIYATIALVNFLVT